MGPTYTITILTAEHHELRKTISLEGVKGYKNEYSFSTTYNSISDINQLYNLLVELEDKPYKCVIRGVKKDDTLRWHNRCYKSKTKPNHLKDIEQNWLMIDYDIPVSVSAEEISDADLPKYILKKYLPPALHDADYIFQHSATAKVRGKRGKGHYWFLLDDYIQNKILKEWADIHEYIDGSLYQPVQIHYTATPKFIDMGDPITRRTMLVKQKYRTVVVANIKTEVANYKKSKPTHKNTNGTTLSTGGATGGWRDIIAKISASNAHDHYKVAAGKFRNLHGKYADWEYFIATTIQRMEEVGHDRASDYEGVGDDIMDMAERYGDTTTEQNKKMNTDWTYSRAVMKGQWKPQGER